MLRSFLPSSRHADPLLDEARQALLERGGPAALLDAGLRLRRVNAALAGLLPGAAEFLGQPVEILVAAGGGEILASAMAAARAQGRAECSVTLAGGQKVRVTCLGLADGILLLLADEAPLHALRAQLAAAARAAEMGQLAAGIAHDFRNLLTAIGGAAQAIGDRAGSSTETMADARQIQLTAQRGEMLIRRLLSGGTGAAPQALSLPLDPALSACAWLLQNILGPRIELELQLDAADAAIGCDATTLDRILVNLAANARDAMDGVGSFTLRSHTHEDAEGSWIVLDVTDSGRGMAADVIEHAFEPFFTTRAGAGGTGLGLATVRGLMQACGGRVNVASAPGQGTCFSLAFPACPAMPTETVHPAIEAPAPAAAPSPPAEGHTVLLVDDEAPVRLLAARAFAARGWQVLEAESGQEALLRAVSHAGPIDLVISDVVMPGLDGPSLVAELRHARPTLRAILTSGYAAETLGAELQGLAVSFIAKPYSLHALLEAAAEQIRAPVPQLA